MGHGEVLLEVHIHRGTDRFEILRFKQGQAQAMHFLADGVILLAEGQQLGELIFQLGNAVAQGNQLPLGKGDCLSVVRMGHRQVGQQGRVPVEEIGVFLQELDDVGRIHGGAEGG
jgi:hypothetical protein